MKNKLKKLLPLSLVAIILASLVFGVKSKPMTSCTYALDYLYEDNFSYSNSEREVQIDCHYGTYQENVSDIDFEISIETNEETLKKFEKKIRKEIDAADVGEVIYVATYVNGERDHESVYGIYTYKVKLPKFYKNKDIAIFTFVDEEYRNTKNLRSATVDDDGYLTITGSSGDYAYVIGYNGAYKQLIIIGVLLFSLLTICVLVKIYCLKRDDPHYQEKKKQKAIAKSKEQHKQNRKLAQELKRKKEQEKQNSKNKSSP